MLARVCLFVLCGRSRCLCTFPDISTERKCRRFTAGGSVAAGGASSPVSGEVLRASGLHYHDDGVSISMHGVHAHLEARHDASTGRGLLRSSVLKGGTTVQYMWIVLCPWLISDNVHCQHGP